MKIPIRPTFTTVLAILVLPFLLLSCVSSNKPSGAVSIPPAVLILLEPVPDPLEGYNRTVQVFNQGLLTHLIRPVSQAYNFLLPELAREGITNASENLHFPRRVVNCLLQGKFTASWDETKRFGINSTVGILGLRDQASDWNVPLHDEDFGQTFAHYGLGQGFFFNLPVLGPSNGRDTLGKICDFPLDIGFWLFKNDTASVISGARNGNELAERAEPLYRIMASQYDSYPMTKAVATWRRKAQASDYQMPETQGDPDQSFAFLNLQPRDRDFGLRARNRSVQVGTADSKMPYICYPVKDAKGIVIILPGLGGHRLSNSITGLAELLNSAQLSAIAISSSLTPDYFLHLPDPVPPGYLLQDCQQLALALQTILTDYRQRFSADGQACSLLGFSLGALNTLYLAELVHRGEAGDLQFERYLAINPPKNVFTALQRIDEFFAIPNGWPENEQQQRLEEVFLKIASFMQNGISSQVKRMNIPFTREESQFLIGLNMRMNLAETFCASQKQLQQNILTSDPSAFNKNALWREALSTSFQDYLEKSLLPFYQAKIDQNLTVKELSRQSDLSYLEKSLRDNQRVRLLHNKNDFLVTEQQIEWYSQVFSQRAVILPEGGHLGNMYHPAYQKLILQALVE